MSMSRREFVKVSAAVPFIGTAAAVAKSAYVAGSDTIKLGLIGCGGRGTGAAMQALHADKGAVLWAMGDVFQDRLDSSHHGLKEQIAAEAKEGGKVSAAQVEVSDDHKHVGFDSFERVLDSGVDAVLITGYPYFRPAHIKAAIAAGKHVFAEKPIAVDAPGVRSFISTCEEAQKKNLAVMVGFCWRYHTGMRKVFEQINSGGLGDVTSVHTTYHTGTLGKRERKPEWSDLEFQMRNWWHFTWISGDHIVEQAVHSIDRMSWAMNDKLPSKISCLGGRAARSGPESGHVYDHFAAIYEYDDGRRCFHTCRQIDRCPGDNSDYVFGTQGRSVVDGWKGSFSITDHKGKETWGYKGQSEDASRMYQNEHDELFASIRSGKPINDGVRGAYSTMMAIAARMAAYTGQTLTWDQALNSKEVLGPAKLDFAAALPTPPVAIPGQTKFL